MGNLRRFISPEMLALALAKLRGEQPAISVAIGPDALIPLSDIAKESRVTMHLLRRVVHDLSHLWCIRCHQEAGKRACGCRSPRWGIPMRDVEGVVREGMRRMGQRVIGSEK